MQINHNLTGIEILIDCTTDEAKEALKLARGVYDDGITFEINSYVVLCRNGCPGLGVAQDHNPSRNQDFTVASGDRYLYPYIRPGDFGLLS